MQSKTIILALVVALVSSCSRNNYFEHQLRSNLPTAAHGRPIDVYFENGETPDRDYIEFYDLRVIRKGNFNDRQMVKFLQQEAQKKGMDAITELHKWDEEEITATLFDVIATAADPDGFDYTTTINYSVIEGKGVKYIENIDLRKSVKTGKVYHEATGDYVGKVSYLPNGRMQETTAENEVASFLFDTYFKLSEGRLLHEQKDWQTLHYADGRIDVRRKYRMNDWLLERVRVNYDPLNVNRIRTIRLTENPGHGDMVTRLKYEYNDIGQLIERKAVGASNFKEKFFYKDGHLAERRLYLNGEEYRIDFEYYQQSDLKDLIKKVEETQ